MIIWVRGESRVPRKSFPRAQNVMRKDFASPGTDDAMSRGPYQLGGLTSTEISLLLFSNEYFGFRLLLLQEIASFLPFLSRNLASLNFSLTSGLVRGYRNQGLTNTRPTHGCSFHITYMYCLCTPNHLFSYNFMSVKQALSRPK